IVIGHEVSLHAKNGPPPGRAGDVGSGYRFGRRRSDIRKAMFSRSIMTGTVVRSSIIYPPFLSWPRLLRRPASAPLVPAPYRAGHAAARTARFPEKSGACANLI